MAREDEEHALRIFRSHLSSISHLMDDPDIQEIMVNNADNVWVERRGVMERIAGIEITDVNMRAAIKALAGSNSKAVQPVLDCRMTGFRIAAAMSPVAIHGNALCIRKHSRVRRTLEDYRIQSDAVMQESHHEAPPIPVPGQGGATVLDLLRWIVLAKKNVLIAGSTGSGKTTFMNALLTTVPDDERVLTIEDTAELQIGVPNYVGLETSEAAGVGVRNLVRLALRFRPDRIVVGEIRGAEAYDLLDAMNTGHSGGACSMHADSPILALARLESMVRMNPDAANLPLPALRAQIASTFEFVVYCARAGAFRGPTQIVQVLGVKDGEYAVNPLFSLRKGN